MKKFLYLLLCLIVLLVIGYFVGPKPNYVLVDNVPMSLDVHMDDLDEFIADKESKVSQVKKDNEGRIVWLDSTKTKTKYALVYMHGFSASQEEGDPLHVDFAKRYGMNAYLPRIYDHGRQDTNTFKNLTPELLIESAKEALAIGKKIGEEVILMSCSTGGTYSIYLAANDPAVHSLIMYSPNIDLHDPTSDLVTKPWGAKLLKQVFGSEYNTIDYSEEAKKYWNDVYHLDGIVALQGLLEQTMTEEIFNQISVPVFIGYWYKNDEEFDDVVSIDAMKQFMEDISTSVSKQKIMAFPNVASHVISSHVMSKDLESVRLATYSFAEDVLKLIPKTNADGPE